MKQALLLCWWLCWWFFVAVCSEDFFNSTASTDSASSTTVSSLKNPYLITNSTTTRYSVWGTSLPPNASFAKPSATNVIRKQVSQTKNSFWDNLGSFRKNLTSMFPAPTKPPTTPKESRQNPLLSSLLSWPSPLNKPGAAGTHHAKVTTRKPPLMLASSSSSLSSSSNSGKWAWPPSSTKNESPTLASLGSLSSLLTSVANATQGRHAAPQIDKYAGGSSNHPSYHQHHQAPHHPHSNYKPFASPYGSHKPESHYSHEHYGVESHGYGPYEHGHNTYEEHYTHSLYQPHLPPLPPDGALAPVYEPHAKVSVSADFVELKCNVYGDALPHIRWVKLAGKGPHGHILFTTIAEGSHVLLDHYHYAVRTDGRSSRLIIRDPDPHVHYGTYQCQVMIAGNYNHVTNDDFVVGRPY